MTFSIIAYDSHTDKLGVAAATGNLLVGQFVPHCLHGVGAVASQGYTPDPNLALKCLQYLAQHESVCAFENRLNRVSLNPDAQIMAMDMHGQVWGYSGEHNLEYKNIFIEDGLAVAGNWLSSEKVLTVMLECFHKNQDKELGWRLIRCLDTAYRSGSDIRGTFSAALKLDDGKTMPVDLRIDYSQTPIDDLKEVYTRWHDDEYQAFLKRLPARPCAIYKNILRGTQ